MVPFDGGAGLHGFEKSRWITTLSEDSTGRFTYSDDEAPEVRQTIDVTADDQGIARIKLLTGEPGNWLVRAADESGKELFVIPYGTAGGRLADFADGMLPTAELRAKLEKTNLNAGDTVRVSLLSPVSGFALASFESAEVISTSMQAKICSSLKPLPISPGVHGCGSLSCAARQTPRSS